MKMQIATRIRNKHILIDTTDNKTNHSANVNIAFEDGYIDLDISGIEINSIIYQFKKIKVR